MKKPARIPFLLAVVAMWCGVLDLCSQTPPTVTTQPTSQAVLAGTNVTFSVGVSGTGPFTYQWQLNDTNLSTNIITTVAGCAQGQQILEDGLPATNAELKLPSGAAVDSTGNLYIADTGDSRIRIVNTNGIINTVAGTVSGNTSGLSGDGGLATNGLLSSPFAVALDMLGNFYIVDTDNNRIRMVNTNGIITTVAGGGSSGDGAAATNASLNNPYGVTLDSAGNLFIADTFHNRIRKVDTNGIITTVAGNGTPGFSGNGTNATNATLYNPKGVALDAASNLYIADTSSQRIRKVDTNGIITTVAGNGSPGYAGDGGAATNAMLNAPWGIIVDSFGYLYIADSGNNRIRQVDPAGVITTLAGVGEPGVPVGDGGPPAKAPVAYPYGVALDSEGNLFIADTGHSSIRKVVLYGERPSFSLPSVNALEAGNYSVVISNQYGSVTSAVAALTVQAPPIITVQPASQIVVQGTSPVLSVSAAGSGSFEYLWFLDNTNLVQSNSDNTLTVADVSTNSAGNYTVVVTNSWGSVTSQIATLTLVYPPAISIQQGSQTAVAGSSARINAAISGTGPFTYQWQLNGTNLPVSITTVAGNGTGGYAGDGGAATNAQLTAPWGIAFDPFGNLFIADEKNHRIRELGTNGIITTAAGNGTAGSSGDGGPATNAEFAYAAGVAVDDFGNLFIADENSALIRKVGTNGIITTVAGGGAAGDGGAATNARLFGPTGVAVDGFGNLLIADSVNNRIRKVGTNGIISTAAGIGIFGFSGDGGPAPLARFNRPCGVAVDALGNLFIADSENSRIRKVGTNGIINTVAGNGTFGYSGDGAVATNAELNYPIGVAVDGFGQLFIADTYNNCIRKVGTSGVITTVAGNGGSGYSGDGGAATNAELNFPPGVAVDGFGDLFIADYSNNCIREVVAQGPVLSLNNLTTNNAGDYDLVVTSPYTSVTSSVVTLTVVTNPPQLVTSDGFFGFSGNDFGFNVSGTPTETVIVEASTDLLNWTPLCTNTLSGSQDYFCDPAWTNYPQRFYRARLP